MPLIEHRACEEGHEPQHVSQRSRIRRASIQLTAADRLTVVAHVHHARYRSQRYTVEITSEARTTPSP